MDSVIAEIFDTARRKLTLLLTVFRLVLIVVAFVLTALTRLLTVLRFVLIDVAFVLTAFSRLLIVVMFVVFVKPELLILTIADESATKLPLLIVPANKVPIVKLLAVPTFVVNKLIPTVPALIELKAPAAVNIFPIEPLLIVPA